jgi:hypothetical protein
MDFHAVNCRPNVLKLDGHKLFIMQQTCIVVAQKRRCLKDLGFEWKSIKTVYWLPLTAVCIFCSIVEHQITVSISLRWAQWWVSMEHQRFTVWPIQQSNGCIVASIQWRSIRSLIGNMAINTLHAPLPQWVSTISGLAFWIITGPFNGV